MDRELRLEREHGLASDFIDMRRRVETNAPCKVEFHRRKPSSSNGILIVSELEELTEHGMVAVSFGDLTIEVHLWGLLDLMRLATGDTGRLEIGW